MRIDTLPDDVSGDYRFITQADPAAGVQLDSIIATTGPIKIIAFELLLVTGVAVTPRQVRGYIQDAGKDITLFVSTYSHSASVTANYPGVINCAGTSAIATLLYHPIHIPPNCIIPVGSTFNLRVANLDAGDQISAFTMLVMDFPAIN